MNQTFQEILIDSTGISPAEPDELSVLQGKSYLDMIQPEKVEEVALVPSNTQGCELIHGPIEIIDDEGIEEKKHDLALCQGSSRGFPFNALLQLQRDVNSDSSSSEEESEAHWHVANDIMQGTHREYKHVIDYGEEDSDDEVDSDHLGRLIKMFGFPRASADDAAENESSPIFVPAITASEEDIFDDSLARQAFVAEAQHAGLSIIKDDVSELDISLAPSRTTSWGYHRLGARPLGASVEPKRSRAPSIKVDSNRSVLLARKIRKESISLFRKCDIDRDGALNFVEFGAFMQQSGFFSLVEILEGERELPNNDSSSVSYPNTLRASKRQTNRLNMKQQYHITALLKISFTLADFLRVPRVASRADDKVLRAID
jgi:hypothetical protein